MYIFLFILFILDNDESERAENDIFWVGIKENLLFLVSCL